MNLDNELTANKMSGLLEVRYRKLSTKIFYMLSSTFSKDSSLPSLKLVEIGVLAYLKSYIFNLFKMFEI